jgi:hypothetical protein
MIRNPARVRYNGTTEQHKDQELVLPLFVCLVSHRISLADDGPILPFTAVTSICPMVPRVLVGTHPYGRRTFYTTTVESSNVKVKRQHFWQ